jgi:hypothetical protein
MLSGFLCVFSLFSPEQQAITQKLLAPNGHLGKRKTMKKLYATVIKDGEEKTVFAFVDDETARVLEQVDNYIGCR